MVAVLLMLVETVLIPAAKMAAISSPVIPRGNPVTMKCGNTLSPVPGNFKCCRQQTGLSGVIGKKCRTDVKENQ